ncbi:hypothetical protein JOC86_001188 [Bacillus pakistanensis]|uniref:Uncharacterized protein n=1 Tax=Rossellomorea pakistanensis TaxID=992288 RepID=A0ABS2NAP9_9BACI|nr:hypothetical protein [Bacillus pakistanensis]MBM7584651.1 hypothetical protein [Bacillus pakistanensis]
MSTIIKNFVITVPSFDRNHGDHNELTKEFIEIWNEVPKILSEIKQEVVIGELSLKINWDSFVLNTQR